MILVIWHRNNVQLNCKFKSDFSTLFLSVSIAYSIFNINRLHFQDMYVQMQGSVSQIFDLDLVPILMTKNGKI